jgi:hypothetical protein
LQLKPEPTQVEHLAVANSHGRHQTVKILDYSEKNAADKHTSLFSPNMSCEEGFDTWRFLQKTLTSLA